MWASSTCAPPGWSPPGGTTPGSPTCETANEAYTYSANDASVGDVDGDGVYEIILKWDPSNAKDNSQSGCTGNVYIDALQAERVRGCGGSFRLYIRAGAHDTRSSSSSDADGDGKAEMAPEPAALTSPRCTPRSPPC